MDVPLGTVQLYVVAPLTPEIEYAAPVCPAQTADAPEIAPAAPILVTVTARLLGVPSQLPFELAGTTVKVNEQAAQILYVSPEEVQFVVPDGLNDGPAEFVRSEEHTP